MAAAAALIMCAEGMNNSQRLSWIHECNHAGNEATWAQARKYQAELIHKNGTMVDLSCCNGIALHDLCAWSGKNIVPYGSDINAIVFKARHLFPDADYGHFVHMNMVEYVSGQTIPQAWPQTFDFVHLNLGFAHLPHAVFFKEFVVPLLRRVSPGGGRLLISFYPYYLFPVVKPLFWHDQIKCVPKDVNKLYFDI